MREIKFRAWQKQYKTIWYDGGHMDLSLRLDGGLFTPDPYYADEHDKKFILMQYTGLKDKNGVECYEGDILLWTNKNLGEDLREAYEVFWESPRFMMKTVGRDIRPEELDTDISDLEVIGNIYENPELLK